MAIHESERPFIYVAESYQDLLPKFHLRFFGIRDSIGLTFFKEMRPMKRTIIAATAAALLASATFGIAAPEFRPGGRPHATPQQMAEFAGAMSDARIAALHAGLRLTPDQEKLWPTLESALQDASKQRIERRAERRAERAERAKTDTSKTDTSKNDAATDDSAADETAKAERPDVIERLRERADGMVERGETMKKLADAAAPLYDSLDEAQKRRFGVLFRQTQNPHMAFAGHEGKRGWGHGPHRFGPGSEGGPMHHRMGPGPMPGGPDGPAADGPEGEPL